MVNTLLSSVSHDLRTPLSVITGSASALLEPEAPLAPEARKDLAATIHEEAQRLNRLVRNLLDMTRVASGAIKAAKEWQPIDGVIGAAIDRVEEALRGRTVTVHLPPGLPLVPIDGVLVEQVLINLLENAAKYTPAGTPVSIAARVDDGALLVEVSDTGPGIPPAQADRIFEKFYRLPREGGGGGVGLGLAICRGSSRRTAGAWGPTIAPREARCSGSRCRSRAGRPRSCPRTAGDANAPDRRRRAAAAALPAELLAVRRVQAARGGDGRGGPAAAAEHTPDVVLLDLGLPDIDGIEVTRRLREWTATPIIILSARGQDQDKVAALDAGADDYLTKPFSLPELLARLRVATRHIELRGEREGATFALGELRIDFARRVITLAGEEVRLTPIEYRLLTTLARKAGRVLTYQQLLKDVWGPRYATQKQYLHVYMGHLRAKLERDPARPRLLVTEPGVGYRLKLE